MANSQKLMLVIRSSRPRFRNNNHKVEFVVHATFVAMGRPALAKDALASTPTKGFYARVCGILARLGWRDGTSPTSTRLLRESEERI
ncbi:unnamed protein product [Eruca vesicaria subsp. sativa]|uniref:Uncharacterized protein n=1 Tax=Eruca vesicaria subsp. sativa TaxID=29727 RepID=A0ABC8J2M4_ERUVS|nr:unnamed protein product [Eruca vesicaria subsp. sativa]